MEDEVFEVSYPVRHSKLNFGMPRTLLVVFIICMLFLILVFFTDKIVSVTDVTPAVVSSYNSVKRDNVIETTGVVIDESANVNVVTNTGTVDPLGSLSMPDVEHWTYTIPELTCGEVGGYYVGMKDGPKNSPLGVNMATFNIGYWLRHMSRSATAGIRSAGPTRDADCLTYYVNYNGQPRYMACVASYFGTDYVKKNGKVMMHCAMFDVILKDGTVIPCVFADAKADKHCNGYGTYSDGTYSGATTALNYPEYKFMFQSLDGSVLEIVTDDNKGSEAIAKFKAKFGITKDNPMSQIVMYNKKM